MKSHKCLVYLFDENKAFIIYLTANNWTFSEDRTKCRANEGPMSSSVLRYADEELDLLLQQEFNPETCQDRDKNKETFKNND